MDITRTTLHLGEHTHTYGLSLSGLAVRGQTMMLAPDEGAALLRLTRQSPGEWGDPRELPLGDAVDLPGGPDDEVDVEGIDVQGSLQDGLLWVTGSHSVKRKRVKPGTPAADVLARLATVSAEKPRRVLARLPLADGLPVPGAGARLPAGRRGLFGALADDEHLGPFLGVPGKDNGFDVEGLAVLGEPSEVTTVLLGLRGPVLRGWAVILEVRVGPGEDPGELALLDVSKHVLDLGGLGVRDLVRDGEDLLVLAGPTMVLSRPARVLRLRGAAGAGALGEAVFARDVEELCELTTGDGEDHPEAIAVVGEDSLLVLHDSPAPDRVGPHSVAGDVLTGLLAGTSTPAARFVV
ncbi:DUF3616 domain-containing protein [Actinomycetospora sp.]|uniref:DUF3616 domain-containing protein n=1 Tax=Actinomycetospora sp. TaxID=1872135 RepID=UPI002F402F11